MPQTSGWTGGQYSLFRLLLALGLLWQSVQVFAQGNAALAFLPMILALAPLIVAAAACVFLALGYGDRWAALLLCALWSVWPGLTSDAAAPFIGLLLLLHALMPRAPYGSWERRSAADPGAQWRMPQDIFAAAWLLLALTYAMLGLLELAMQPLPHRLSLAQSLAHSLPELARPQAQPFVRWSVAALQLGFAAAAFWRRSRPLFWAALLLLHLLVLIVAAGAPFSQIMLAWHFFTFDPAWLKAAYPERTEHIFYDGTCGLCHRFVRLVLSEDRTGTAFRFAPLHGETFNTVVLAKQRARLPDSVVVLSDDGQLWVRSAAVIYLFKRLGGLWKVAGMTMNLLPSALLDVAYNGIAAVRYRLFSRPKDVCPILPKELRQRFDP